jgi:hypothetical protein
MSFVEWITNFMHPQQYNPINFRGDPIEVSTLDDIKESIRELSPLHCYNIKEKLRSGQIITHKTDVTKSELLNYCNNAWIDKVPPIFIFEVTTSR